MLSIAICVEDPCGTRHLSVSHSPVSIPTSLPRTVSCRQAKQDAPASEGDQDEARARAEADVKDLIDELETFSEEELLGCLQDRGDTQAGSKEEMIQRLADLIVNEAEM